MLHDFLTVRAALDLVDGLDLGGGLTLLPHDPADPPKPSPIDPVIRDALSWGPLLSWASTPTPVPWRPDPNVVFGPVPDLWLFAALDPQPVPPFARRLAAALLARAELVADASGPEAGASYLRRMVDELCPPPRTIKLPPRKGPWPPSEPRPILGVTISPGDLLLFAATLRSAAPSVAHARLAEAVAAGAAVAAEQAVAALAAG